MVPKRSAYSLYSRRSNGVIAADPHAHPVARRALNLK
jgi:hypothetical protein